MSTNTPKVGEDARGVTCANPQCEDGTVWVENGFGARYLCSDCHATDTEQPPTLNQLETGVESSPATGTEQDIPAAIEWPDSEAIDAAWGVIHDASPVGASVATARTALVVAAKASPVIPLADHHRALSEAVQAEHDRWVEKLQEFIAAARTEAAEYEPASDEGYDQCLTDLTALLAEAEATDAADEQRMEPPTKARGR
jgi:hypothetical protein